MGNGNAPTLQSMCFCEENCRQTYTDWTAVSPETTETGVADLFYTVLFNGHNFANRKRQGAVALKQDHHYKWQTLESNICHIVAARLNATAL